MPIICRLLQLSRDEAAALIAAPSGLMRAVESARIYRDVYRYWDGIRYLLAEHSAESTAADWTELGTAVSAPEGDVPAARVIRPELMQPLSSELEAIAPEDLAAFYDAEQMDLADVYPRAWLLWEETFDPLGQVLEHYTFLQRAAKNAASDGAGLLLYFTTLDDGSDE